MLSAGCAAFHPIHGIPARYLPEEFRGTSRAGKRTIDLSLLRQTPPSTHLVDSGDVLGIYIEGVLGDRKQPQPVNIPLGADVPPSFGFPIPVRDDGTISLPLVGSIAVRGKTIAEVEDLLKQAYTVKKAFLNAENDRILVSLQRPRHYRVLVIRQENPTALNFAAVGQINLGAMKRGTGQVVSLPAYKNDVLHALAQTGGLPGLDAENAIYVIRRRKSTDGWTPAPGSPLPASPSTTPPAAAKAARPRRTVVRAQSPNFRPADATVNVDPQADYRRAGAARPQLPSGSPPVPTAPVGLMQPDILGRYSNPVPPVMAAIPDSSPDRTRSRAGSPAMESVFNAPAPMTDMNSPTRGHPGDAVTGEIVPSPDPVMMTPEQFGWELTDADMTGRRIIKIPVRLGPGETVDLREQDIILEDGDIVFIESRETEVFYTGGLLGGGQFTLPRDYDLNVLQAIAVAQGQRAGAAGGASRGTMSLGGQSALNSDVSISASRVVILRYLDDGRMVPIEVDLYQARTDVAEQVIIQPGDYILLQYTKLEAICAFFERHLLEGALFGLAAAQLNRN